MKRSPELVDGSMHLFSASRHVERVADHATNIAEDVVFPVEAADVRHPSIVAGGKKARAQRALIRAARLPGGDTQGAEAQSRGPAPGSRRAWKGAFQRTWGPARAVTWCAPRPGAGRGPAWASPGGPHPIQTNDPTTRWLTSPWRFDYTAAAAREA